MDLRLALYEMAAEHRLDAPALKRLDALAGLGDPPARLREWLLRGVAVLAAALAGFGVVLWVAANWDTLGRSGRFALIEAVLLVACAVAWRRPSIGAPAGLLALLSIGGLFAYFGQTYQTGADPWQLFALWSVLALPLCAGVRSDIVWAPWALVAMAAISLWIQAHTGYRWRTGPSDLGVFLVGWAAALLVLAALSPALTSLTGAGAWSFRTGLTLVTVMITATAMAGLFDDRGLVYYGLGLLVLVVAAAALCMPAMFDLFGLSAVALGLNALLVAGLGRLLFDDHHGIDRDPIGQLLLIGLGAAALLAATVTGILRLARRRAAPGDAS